MKLQAGAHRPVGSVRRLDAVRLDALDASSSSSSRSRSSIRRRSTPATCNAKFDVLVFVDGGIPDARRRPAAAAARRAAGGRHIPAEFRDWLGTRHRREDGARTEEVRRERRHDPDDRFVDRARPSPRPADSRRARRADRNGAERAAAAREVLHPGLDPRGAHRHHASARLRHGRHGDGVLRREPGVPAAAGGGARRA